MIFSCAYKYKQNGIREKFYNKNVSEISPLLHVCDYVVTKNIMQVKKRHMPSKFAHFVHRTKIL